MLLSHGMFLLCTQGSSDGHVSLYFDEITTVDRHLISEVHTQRERGTEGSSRENKKKESEDLSFITTGTPGVRCPTARSPW